MIGRRSVLFKIFRVVRARAFQSACLLAVLSPVQQGRAGFVPWAASETPSFFAGFARSVSFFEAFPAAKYRVPPASGGAAMHRRATRSAGAMAVAPTDISGFLTPPRRLQRPCHDL